jgi:enediyne polyketide synthase
LSARLEPGADPYLDDHQLDGVPVLPAVVGMEAMAQAASLAAGVDEQPSLTDLRFRSPVTVDDFGGREIRSAALTGSHGVDVVLRDDLDHFTGDRFTGTVVQAPEPPPPRRISTCPRDGTSSWYGSLFFHSGRFRRVAGYDRLSAFGVQAWLNAGDEQSWFSEFHSEQLLLGDPGTHDATLHALLACVPHRRALPVGVDRFTVWRKPVGAFQVVATERAHTADEYVFDVDLLGEDGAVAAGWRGLLLRAVGPLDWPDGLPADLVGPWLSRRLIECGIDDRLELRTAEGNGSPIRIAGTGREIGAASLAVDSSVAVDPADCEDVELLSDKADHDMALSAARVRAVRTILGEKGAGAPLCVDQVTEDGIVVARCGEHRLITARTQVYATDRPTVIALAEKEAA